MKIEITVPKAGLTMTEATVGKWFVREGERVRQHDVIAELVTEKITIEVNAPEAGTIATIFKQEGETVQIGERLAVIETDGSVEVVGEREPHLPVESNPAVGSHLTVETAAMQQTVLYDAAIIGGGPAGYVAAIRASQLGGRVALIEQHNWGGTCLNIGCIPTKTLLRAAEFLKWPRTASRFGIFFDPPRTDFSQLMNYKEEVVRKLQNGIVQLLKKHDVDLLHGKGKVVAPHRVVVEAGDGERQTIEARNIIVATGSRPKLPEIPGLREAQPMTSNEALTRHELPNSIAILGGGAIGCEFAAIYAAWGAKVTVIESAGQILPGFDQELAKHLRQALQKENVQLLVSTQVEQVRTQGDQKILLAKTANGTEEILVEEILVATGRIPNAENLRELGVQQDGEQIQVDEQMRTSIPSIYAVGDVIGKEYLAHVASAQGIVAAEAIMGKPSKMDYRSIPRCIYTSPEIACVGLSESEAAAQGYDFQVGKYYFQANGRALTYGQAAGFAKVLREKRYGQILGVHIIGPNATDLISEAVLAMHLEATAEEFAMALHPHPTLSEALWEAVLSSMGRGIHS
ncbi:dihydrolipoyl dehydrogenase [Brevibacillus marinus]|uniref:dihydrolipoyl dehydrogenase n=1 Tax=Brevibacillus marinus TaxID=2496837 RepID=UPI000F84439C|nr:dihydrolipoyl dehydrogenase [Brevibacillus marinus]